MFLKKYNKKKKVFTHCAHKNRQQIHAINTLLTPSIDICITSCMHEHGQNKNEMEKGSAKKSMIFEKAVKKYQQFMQFKIHVHTRQEGRMEDVHMVHDVRVISLRKIVIIHVKNVDGID